MIIEIKGKSYSLPIFLPDATHATIKSLDSLSLENTGIRGLVTNTYHLLTDEIIDIVNKSGGIKAFMNFNGLVITDSGGFQAMSLVHKNSSNGKFTDDGIIFKNHKNGNSLYLTPETCIETQVKLGSDIIMVLDDCTDPSEPLKVQKTSVERTIRWAKRCKDKYKELTSNLSVSNRPWIFGIVQGGNNQALREECAKALIDIGFDGYAYGGWPLENGIFLNDILKFTAELMPNDKPKYAMGVGKPQDILYCTQMGYNMFDCVIATRDARHGRMYLVNEDNITTLNISNEIHKSDFGPIDLKCDCYTCLNYSKAYLRHLLKSKENTFNTLATIHNLYNFAKIFN